MRGEWPIYPQYYIPVDEIRADLLVDERHGERTTLNRPGFGRGSNP